MQKAVAGKDERLKELSKELRASKEEIEKCEKGRMIDVKIMSELSQDKLALKELNVEKEGELASVAAAQEALEKELEE